MNFESYLIADHLKSSFFIISDGTLPSGKQRGYILRRLIRRSLSNCLKLGIDILDPKFYEEVLDTILGIYGDVYPELATSRDKALAVFVQESLKYHKSIETGKKAWFKILKQL